MFFSNWSAILRVVIVGVLAYAGLILLLRISGKRTLSKMNAFDFVVTVALGSTLATVLLSKDVTLAEGLTGFGLLIGLQYGISYLSTRSAMVSSLVKSEPSLLLYNGSLLLSSLKRERVTASEVYAGIRAAGFGSLAELAAVVLETDGSITAVPRVEGRPTALGDLTPPEEGQ